MNNTIKLEYIVSPDQEGLYLTLPFTIPPDVESFTLSYEYDRYHETVLESEQGSFKSRQEVNIVDLGLISPNGEQVGVSGSDKMSIQVGETDATPGYRPCTLIPGEWLILIGAYKVAPSGVTVTYELAFTPKSLRLFKGDLHTHTFASDGVLSTEELGQHALRHGLNYLAITDHNQIVSAKELPRIPGLTLIPGVEWTHYQGHANFLGVDTPYDGPFFTNNLDEVQGLFLTARERGALITLNHPFEEICPLRFDLNSLPFDCLEIWNGPMRESNFRAIGLWQHLLISGKKVPICGGSDYHRDQQFVFLGGPTTCIFAKSASPSDLLDGLRRGNAYITFAPNGPSLEMKAGEAIVGDSVPFSNQKEIQFGMDGLLIGDVIQVITNQGSTPLMKAEANGQFQGTFTMNAPGFARLEVLREFLPGIPPLPALISNPIYFDLA